MGIATNKSVRFAGFLAASAIASTATAQPATFQGIGDLPGGIYRSYASGISADGTTVLGESEASAGKTAVRWQAGVLTALGGSTFSSAYRSTPDGSRCVGFTSGDLGMPTIWDAAGATQLLGRLPCGTNGSALDISADGSTVIGYTNSCSASAYNAFRWTAATGMVSLGDLAGGAFASVARAVSADGSVIAGVGAIPGGDQAWRWTAGSGLVALPYLPGGSGYSDSFGMSRNGAMILGSSAVPGGRAAFFWTTETGTLGLGDLPGGTLDSGAISVTDDGRVIVGYGTTAAGRRAMVWDAQRGMRELSLAVATDFGLNVPTGWTLTSAAGISADGSAIAGYGTNPSGQTEGWVIRVGCWLAPAISGPTPSFVACPGANTAIGIAPLGTGPFTYHWRKNTVPIDTVASPSAATATLSFASLTVADAGSYDCIVTNGCGDTTSNAAQLFVDPSDVGQQGGLPGRDGLHDNNDFVVYIDLFFNQQPAADLGKQGGILGSDGQFDNNDFVVFIDQFFAGC